MDLDDPATVRPLNTNVAQYVTVQTFAKELRPLVVEELTSALKRRSQTIRDSTLPLLPSYAASKQNNL